MCVRVLRMRRNQSVYYVCAMFGSAASPQQRRLPVLNIVRYARGHQICVAMCTAHGLCGAGARIASRTGAEVEARCRRRRCCCAGAILNYGANNTRPRMYVKFGLLDADCKYRVGRRPQSKTFYVCVATPKKKRIYSTRP